MEQQEGFIVKGQERKVCQLRKAIYSLKQATLQWNKQLHKSLLEMGFTCCTADPGTYYKITGDMIIILLIYVNDALFMDSDKAQLLNHKKTFIKQWKSHDLGKAKEYLGMRITRDCKAHMITLDQTYYVEKVAKCFGQENCKEVSTPLSTRYSLRSNEGNTNPTLRSCYQLVIGSLLYIMLETRPDIAYLVIKMAQFSTNPSEEHPQRALYIVCYLSSTMNLCIWYSASGNQNGLIAYFNTDWAGDHETSCFTTGYAIFLANSIVFWLSRQQKRIRLSSTEAEYCDMTVMILLLFCHTLLISFNTSHCYWRGLCPSNLSYLLIIGPTSSFFSCV